MRDVIEIETKRLKLRALRITDAARVARFCGDPGVGRMLAMTPQPYLPVAAEGWIMIVQARASAGNDYVFGVEMPGEGLIGVIGAHRKQGDAFEIGYWYGRPYWGHGFASEAGSAFVAQAHALGELQSGHFVDNPASGRVLEKIGFAYTGETEPMFSLSRGESVACKRMRYAAGGTRAEREAELAIH